VKLVRASGAERGQALIETVIFMPLLLLSLFGVLWAIQLGVQYERIEVAIRYAGVIQQLVSPYNDYSLSSMYTELGPGPSTPPIPCASPPSTELADGAPYLPMPATRVSSPPIFTPNSIASPLPCASAGTYGLAGSPTGTVTQYQQNGQTYTHTQVEDDLFSIQRPQITSQINVPNYLSGVLGSTTSVSSTAEYFERGPTVQQILFCFQSGNALAPSLNEQISNTLKWSTDPNPSVATTPLPSVVPPMGTPADSYCVTGGSSVQ
jgi:hypothetical protein